MLFRSGEKAADKIDSMQAQKIAAHNKLYCVVKDYILRNVIEGKEVVQLRSMCNLYMKTLENQGFPNFEYCSEKLARRLQGDKDMSNELPWPPTAQELDAVKMDVLLPEHLVQFLSSVTGTLDGEKCEKTQGLVYSITQDVCQAATNSKWKLPKYILLCATLQHLYRSKQVSYKFIYCLRGPILSMLNSFCYRYFILIFTKALFCLCSSQPSFHD